MSLNMRCQHCSVSKVVESDKTDSATLRCEIACANGWYAFVNEVFKVPLYFCSSLCETKYKAAIATSMTACFVAMIAGLGTRMILVTHITIESWTANNLD